VHSTVYSHLFRFKWEAHFYCCASSHVFRTEKAFQHIKLVHLRLHFFLDVCRSNVVSCLHLCLCLISKCTKGNIFMVALVVKYFATVHLFIINTNSVLEEIIR